MLVVILKVLFRIRRRRCKMLGIVFMRRVWMLRSVLMVSRLLFKRVIYFGVCFRNIMYIFFLNFDYFVYYLVFNFDCILILFLYV